MKPFAAFAALALLVAAPLHAQMVPVDLGTNPALAIAGRDLPENDAKVVQARTWLKQAAAASGESEEQVAASVMKLTRFFYDGLKLRVLPMEVLEGLAVQAKSARPLGELTNGYFQARRNATDRSHKAALAALAGGN